MTAPWQMSVWGLMKLVLALACLFGLISVLNRRERPRERPGGRNVSNNLKQIAIALHSYHEQYGSLPPAYVADANGRPMHSWRVLSCHFSSPIALRSIRFPRAMERPKQ